MAEPQVTITLGRSGQVVKRPFSASQTPSRTKRSLPNHSFLFTNKRARRNDSVSVKSSVSYAAGSSIGRNDLRLKLMRKRMSESRKKSESHGTASSAVLSVEISEGRSMRSIPSSRGERQRAALLNPAYSFKAADERRKKPNDAVSNASTMVANMRYMNETRQGTSSRLNNISGPMASSDAVKPSPPNISVPLPSRPVLDAHKKEPAPPRATRAILRSSQPNALPLTTNSFLHSLGLEKYAIQFQAEEIDMAALKQMGDRDLKELGLPMGPRKKILLAISPASRPLM